MRGLPQGGHTNSGPNSLEVAATPKVARKISAAKSSCVVTGLCPVQAGRRRPSTKSTQLRRSEGRAGCDPAQFEHAVADVAILCQMGGSNRFAGGGHHLIERAASVKFRVEFPAEFTRPAGACVEAADDGWISMFHGRRLLGGENGFARFVGQRQNILPSADSFTARTTHLYYKGWDLYKPFVATANFLLFRASGIAQVYRKRGNPGCILLRRWPVISGMIRPRFSPEIA